MSSSYLYFFGALLLVASVFSVQLINPAMALGRGPYTLMQHSNTTANAGVFRLDTTTGGVSYCYLTPNIELNCTKEVQ